MGFDSRPDHQNEIRHCDPTIEVPLFSALPTKSFHVGPRITAKRINVPNKLFKTAPIKNGTNPIMTALGQSTYIDNHAVPIKRHTKCAINSEKNV